MENTSDSARPSDFVNNDERSYLFGRDPSIISYGQRPQVCSETKRNLLSLYEVEEHSTLEENVSSACFLPDYMQTVKVYLRMKPFPRKIKLSKDQEEAYSVINSTTLFTRLPASDNNTSYLNKTKGNNFVCRKFIFTKTFGPDTTQLGLFDNIIKPKMVEFLQGQNCTVMTYGTTNSGKSYTLQGTISSPGIIPRALEFVFSNITPKATPSYKPVHNHDVIALDAPQRARELEEKAKLLAFGSTDKNQYASAYRQMQQLLQDESPLRPSHCTDAHYSVWISFAEIYNETIYDLLSNECQKKKQPLKLATDSEGRAFIKGLKMICVNSGSEAYQVLMAGQYNLKVAATALNARSSRSHCIFTIKLLKYHVEYLRDAVEVSTFAFCDLAGSERLKKTLNVGSRLKEAQNINTSLLVLGKCLKYIYEGQNCKPKNEHIGPFRESKLTRLFQQALSGKEHIALIVNVNPVPTLYVETQNVLTFSAIAKKIVIEPTKIAKKKSKTRFSHAIAQSIRSITDWDSADIPDVDEETTDEETQAHDDDIYDKLIDENENLKKELTALKSSTLERDIRIRQEMADKYSIIIKRIEEDWKNRVKDVEARQEDTLESTVRQVEEFYEKKLNELNNPKRKRRNDNFEDYDYEDDDKKAMKELVSENSYLTSKVESLKGVMKKLKEEKTASLVEKNRTAFECSIMKEELRSVKDLLKVSQEVACTDEEKVYIQRLESQLSAERDRVRKLKEFLNEAKEEYIEITTDAREKEKRIKELEEAIVEHADKTDELETDLGNANVCLMEKTKLIEVLEEKLESRSEKLSDAEAKVQLMEKRIHGLEVDLQKYSDKILDNDNLIEAMQKEITELRSANKHLINQVVNLSENKVLKTENISTVEACREEIVIKEEIASDSTEVRPENQGEIENQIKMVQKENAALKARLIQDTTEIQSLRDSLEEAKIKLKDISVQLSVLKLNAPKATSNEKGNEIGHVNVAVQVEIPTQSRDLEIDNAEKLVETKDSNSVTLVTHSQSKQTSFTEHAVEDQSVQTSILVDEKSENAEKELADIKEKYDNLEAKFKRECSRTETLSEELSSLRNKVQSLMELSNSTECELNRYKSSIEALQMDLSAVRKEKDNFEEKLMRTEKVKDNLQQRIDDCTAEHESKINTLERELSIANEQSEIKTHCIGAHEERILELEKRIDSVQELHDKIAELTRCMETCREENNELQRLLDENNRKLSEHEENMNKAHRAERDKDEEIKNLQMEMKHLLRNHGNEGQSAEMEMELKKTLKELIDSREAIKRKDELLQTVESRQTAFEQNAKIIDLLQQSAQDRQADNDRLRSINEELKNSLLAKDCEMESFRKNRDETITKYEGLVKSQQEELERQKREVMRFQELFRRQTTPTATPNKDETKKLKSQLKELEDKLKRYESFSKGTKNINTSDDEVSLSERRVRGRRRKENFTSPNKATSDISVADLCGSEPKQSTRCTTLAPPNVEPTTETKRTRRRKKLFAHANESVEDVEPLESTRSSETFQSPTSVIRSLRSRRR